jgi:hypothetical protein
MTTSGELQRRGFEITIAGGVRLAIVVVDAFDRHRRRIWKPHAGCTCVSMRHTSQRS